MVPSISLWFQCTVLGLTSHGKLLCLAENPGGGAAHLSGLQNPQAARTVPQTVMNRSPAKRSASRENYGLFALFYRLRGLSAIGFPDQ